MSYTRRVPKLGEVVTVSLPRHIGSVDLGVQALSYPGREANVRVVEHLLDPDAGFWGVLTHSVKGQRGGLIRKGRRMLFKLMDMTGQPGDRDHPTKVLASNPKSEVDQVAARELLLFINNDYGLYRSHHVPIIKNLLRKMRKGVFDAEKAVKLFMYLTEAGAKKYGRASGWSGSGIPAFFTKATREAAARELRDEFLAENELGNYAALDLRTGHNQNPLPYDPGFTLERSGVERAAWDKGYLAPTGSTGHTLGTTSSSPDDLLAGVPPVGDGRDEIVMPNPHERQTAPTGSFTEETLEHGFEVGESYGKEGRAGGKTPLPAEARLNPDPLHSSPDIVPAPKLNPILITGEDTMGGADGGHVIAPGGKALPAPEGSDYGGSVLKDVNGRMPRMNPKTKTGGGGDLVYVRSHDHADALNIPAGPDRAWRDSQTSAVVHKGTGEVFGYVSGHTLTRNAPLHQPLARYVDESGRYGLRDYPIFAASDEAAKLVRDAVYTKKFKLVRLETVMHKVRGNPMTLGSGGRDKGTASHVLDMAGSGHVDEGSGNIPAPRLNPKTSAASCPHCGRGVSGAYAPGTYACSGCRGTVEVV